MRNDIPVILLHNIDPSWETPDRDAALREVSVLEDAIRTQGHPVNNVAVLDADLQACLNEHDPAGHVVLNWCDELPGVPHSEAHVARLLESFRYAYTGSTASVLELCWDKPAVKQLLERHRVPTPCWRVCSSPADADGWECFPAIVKPAFEHCSLGLTSDAVVQTPRQLHERLAHIIGAFGREALVEDFIDGREFHVTVWGNGHISALPPVEMDFAAFSDVRDRLCTYDSKFNPGSTHYEKIKPKVPAPLVPQELEELMNTAVSAYGVLGCRDYARIDIRLRDGVFYVLDINPNSDLSSETSMACAAEVEGYSYGAMLSRIINLAASRHPAFGPSLFL